MYPELDEFRREVNMDLACGSLADQELPVTSDDGGHPVVVAGERAVVDPFGQDPGSWRVREPLCAWTAPRALGFCHWRRVRHSHSRRRDDRRRCARTWRDCRHVHRLR